MIVCKQEVQRAAQDILEGQRPYGHGIARCRDRQPKRGICTRSGAVRDDAGAADR
jgi:hypothetical protein